MINLPHKHGNLSDDIQSELPKSQTAKSVADVLKLMADESRIRIFWLLCHYEECVVNVSALLDISCPATSHHLKLLKNAGLVISRREGKEVYYTAAKTPRTEILHEMIEGIMEVECPSDKVFEKVDSYDSLTQTINEIHYYLISNLQNRYTINELAHKYHINQTTLKSAFKMVFGQPIAEYMKGFRIKQAMKLLVKTDKSICEIATMVGYESQSKFTQVFKNITGFLPKEYRKNNQIK